MFQKQSETTWLQLGLDNRNANNKIQCTRSTNSTANRTVKLWKCKTKHNSHKTILATLQYVMSNPGFVNDVTYSCSGPYGGSCVFLCREHSINSNQILVVITTNQSSWLAHRGWSLLCMISFFVVSVVSNECYLVWFLKGGSKMSDRSLLCFKKCQTFYMIM